MPFLVPALGVLLLMSSAAAQSAPPGDACGEAQDRMFDELGAFLLHPALAELAAELSAAERDQFVAELAVAVESLLISLDATCGPRLGASGWGALRRVRVILDGEAAVPGDGRRPLTVEERARFGAVGVIEGKGFEGGTAVLVGDCRTVVTAAHTLTDSDGLRTRDVAFLPQGDPEREARVDWEGSFLPAPGAFLGRDAIEQDVAVLALVEPVDGCTPLGYATVRNTDLAAWHDRLWSVSFHRDTGWDPVVHADCAIANGRVDRALLRASGYRLDLEDIQDEVLLHQCDTAAGSSGSPLMILIGDVPYVIGINTGAPGRPGDAAGSARDELPGALKDRYPNHGVLFTETSPVVQALDRRLKP